MKRNTSPLTSKDATTTKYHKFDNLFKKHKDLQDLLKKFNDFDSLKNNKFIELLVKILILKTVLIMPMFADWSIMYKVKDNKNEKKKI